MNDERIYGRPIVGVLAALLLSTAPLAAVQPQTGASDPAVRSLPSPAEVLGHELGERFTDVAGIVRYMNALASASPRVDVREYGRTPEGRPLLQVVIAREDRFADLDQILDRNRTLTEPATPRDQADRLAAENPAVVYLSYGVHGNESASSEAALWTAWDLARDDASVAGVLDSVLVIVEPAVNPDGRDRYVNWYRQARGQRPNPSPDAWEHWEPWPGGRFNHYLFDLNRDWAWMTQLETRARLGTWSLWSPQVHVDFHEMGWTSTYFFFPATEPINPLYPAHILDWGRYFGEANAAAFDAMGLPYYTGESFDLFYPAYGDSWPSLLGAIGMTYEQGGSGRAGLVIRRPDGSLLTLRDRAEGHRTTGAATLRATAARKTDLLRDFARFHRTVDEGLPDILLIPGPNPERVDALLQLLLDQEIHVDHAENAFRSDARPHPGWAPRREFPAGTLRVPARQPRGRLALTLLQAETEFQATFSYDISAWSLPYAYGVEAHAADRVPSAGWQRIETPAARFVASPVPGLNDGADPYGYLIGPTFDAWPAIIRFLGDEGRATVLARGFHLEGTVWPAGTIFLSRQGNDSLSARVRAAGLGAFAAPVMTGLAETGRDLGTGNAFQLELPRVALVTGEGVSPTSFGAHWFFLENTLMMPFDALPGDRLDEVSLDEYDVLVLPEFAGNWRARFDGRRLDMLSDWVRRGGTLIAVGSSARAVAEPVADIELRADSEPEGDPTDRALLGREARRIARWESQIPGTILQVRLDRDHPLAFGVGIDGDEGRLFVLHRGGTAFEPDDAFESVAFFGADIQRISGVIAAANLERLERSTWLATRRVGRGSVVLFADDPLFRHFWRGTFQVYINVLFLGLRF